MYTYIHGNVKASYGSGLLFTTSDKQEGYMIMAGEGIGSIGFIDGGSIETRMHKAKRKFIRIEVLVVQKEYQKQGYMRKMMEYAYKIADEKKIPVILDTDDRDKCLRYQHLGMKLDRVRNCADQYHIYDLIRETARS